LPKRKRCCSSGAATANGWSVIAELVPLATQRTEAALAAYRGASAPLASVLDARRAEIEARMDQLKLEMETARLWAQLNYLLPSQPGTPKAPHEQNPVLSAPRALAIPLAIVIAMAAGYGLYQLGMHRGMGQLGIARRSRFFPGAPAAAAADVPRSIAEGRTRHGVTSRTGSRPGTWTR
jgi:hypothetical protein